MQFGSLCFVTTKMTMLSESINESMKVFISRGYVGTLYVVESLDSI
jgi:hypothetical protein